MPIFEGPEEDRDEVLYPAMERRKAASSHREMGRGCVGEDADQYVDRDEEPNLVEKDRYISGDSPRCVAAPGEAESHLCSPPVWTLKVVRMSDRFWVSTPDTAIMVRNATKPSSWSLTCGARGNLRAQDVVPVPRFEHHSNIAVLGHERWIVSRDTPVR